VWNHGLFKSLLFLAAGGVIMKAHTRQIDRLGGRAKTMPFTAAAFLLGAVAICGLPPLNGFISEWLVYLGLFGPFTGSAPGEYQVLSLAATALAVVGTLAVACFVKVYGTVFLGLPRQRVPSGCDVPGTMRLPMGVLGGCCVLIGVLPAIGVAAVVPAVAQAMGATRASVSLALAPVGALQPWTITVALALLAAMGLSYLYLRRHPAATTGTWDCGYAQPSARMQYTASSFAASILEMFRWILRPHSPPVRLTGLFPSLARYCSHVGDIVLDGFLIPLWSASTQLLVDRRTRQQGSIQRYLIYICLTLVALLLSLMPWRALWDWMLARG
jgi:hydrogenase-4 component B